MTAIYQLIYCSTVRTNMAPSVDEILEKSRINNARNNVTGMLYFDGLYFLQLLEGSRAQVSNTLARIMIDERHERVELIDFQQTDFRSYPETSMHNISFSKKSMDVIFKHSGSKSFNPYKMPPFTVKNFIIEYDILSKYFLDT